MIQQQNKVWELSSLVSLVGFACTTLTKNLCHSPRFGDSFRFTQAIFQKGLQASCQAPVVVARIHCFFCRNQQTLNVVLKKNISM